MGPAFSHPVIRLSPDNTTQSLNLEHRRPTGATLSGTSPSLITLVKQSTLIIAESEIPGLTPDESTIPRPTRCFYSAPGPILGKWSRELDLRADPAHRRENI